VSEAGFKMKDATLQLILEQLIELRKQMRDIVVEWLTFLLHTQEVLHSNLGPETGYPD
jgi:hypothetical protein